MVALLSAWPVSDRGRLGVEADPDGGVLVSRFEERLRLDRTLEDLAVALRHGWSDDSVARCAREVWPGCPVVVSQPSGELVTTTLLSRGEELAAALAGAAVDAAVDVGRISSRSPALPLAKRSVITALVCRDTLEDAASVRARVAELTAAGVPVGLVVVGTATSADDFAGITGAPLLGVLPRAPRHAGMVGRGGWRRSTWWRDVSRLARTMSALAPTLTVQPNPPAPPPSISGPPPVATELIQAVPGMNGHGTINGTR
jgi:hypothetical protein